MVGCHKQKLHVCTSLDSLKFLRLKFSSYLKTLYTYFAPHLNSTRAVSTGDSFDVNHVYLIRGKQTRDCNPRDLHRHTCWIAVHVSRDYLKASNRKTVQTSPGHFFGCVSSLVKQICKSSSGTNARLDANSYYLTSFHAKAVYCHLIGPLFTYSPMTAAHQVGTYR